MPPTRIGPEMGKCCQSLSVHACCDEPTARIGRSPVACVALLVPQFEGVDSLNGPAVGVPSVPTADRFDASARKCQRRARCSLSSGRKRAKLAGPKSRSLGGENNQELLKNLLSRADEIVYETLCECKCVAKRPYETHGFRAERGFSPGDSRSKSAPGAGAMRCCAGFDDRQQHAR